MTIAYHLFLMPQDGHPPWLAIGRLCDNSPSASSFQRKSRKMLTNILIIILILMLIGALPQWPHSANWGYLPSGGLGIIVLILLILLFTGRL